LTRKLRIWYIQGRRKL